MGNPFWSADSRFVIFDAAGKLTKIDASGGAPRVLCDLSGVLLGGFGTRDNRIVFVAAPRGLQQVSGEGGVPTGLGPAQLVWLTGGGHVLPGGRFIYSSASGVYAAALDGTGTPVQVSTTGAADIAYVQGGRGDDHLLFANGGALLAQTLNP